MSITFVYRDENNKVQVKKIEYEEVKKDLMKYLSHDIRSIIKEKEEDEKFRIDVWEEVTYTKIFEAETKEQAEDIARQEIEVVGCDDWKIGSHADFDVVAVEEVK